MIYSISMSVIWSSYDMGFIPYSKVNNVSYVTLPRYLVSSVFSIVRSS